MIGAATGLGLVDIGVLEACHRCGASPDGPYLKTLRILESLLAATGIGPRTSYEVLLDMARPYVSHLRLIDGLTRCGPPPPVQATTSSRHWSVCRRTRPAAPCADHVEFAAGSPTILQLIARITPAGPDHLVITNLPPDAILRDIAESLQRHVDAPDWHRHDQPGRSPRRRWARDTIGSDPRGRQRLTATSWPARTEPPSRAVTAGGRR